MIFKKDNNYIVQRKLSKLHAKRHNFTFHNYILPINKGTQRQAMDTLCCPLSGLTKLVDSLNLDFGVNGNLNFHIFCTINYKCPKGKFFVIYYVALVPLIMGISFAKLVRSFLTLYGCYNNITTTKA